MFLRCFTSCIGSGRRKWWRRDRVQMQTPRDSCHASGLVGNEPTITKVTKDSPEQGTNEIAPKVEDACTVRKLEPGTLEKLVNCLVPAQRRGDPFFVPAFLATYRRFATTGQVLDLLFRRYKFFHPNSEDDQQSKSALSSFLETWLRQYPGDFCQGPDMACMNQLIAYALINLPNSEIISEVCRLLNQRETH